MPLREPEPAAAVAESRPVVLHQASERSVPALEPVLGLGRCPALQSSVAAATAVVVVSTLVTRQQQREWVP